MEGVTPEIQSEFAHSVMQTIQMLLESLAALWDTEVEDLHRDNRRLVDLLSESARAIGALVRRNNTLTSFVSEIEGVMTDEDQQSLVVSAMRTRNDQLRAILERVLVAFEEVTDDNAYAGLLPVRRHVYRHLREVAVRGWSFWDAASFRERIARERSA
jgi:FtsZ-binding cell division protein ZapB